MGQPGAFYRWFAFYQWFQEVAEHMRRLSRPQAQALAAFSLVPKPGKGWQGQVSAFKKAGWLRCRAVGQ